MASEDRSHDGDTRGATVFRLIEGGHLVLRRDQRTAEFVTPRPLEDDELIHPFLAAAAAPFAVWSGRQVFHAGAFMAAGRARGVLGSREAGKSTLLAHLHLAGQPIVADDVMVVEGESVLAAPRCIDLREPSAAHLGSDFAVPARGGTRSRLALPPIDAETRLGGWIVLDWAEDQGIRALAPNERPGRINRGRMANNWGDDPGRILALAAFPVWELRVPRDWAALPGVIELLLGTVGR